MKSANDLVYRCVSYPAFEPDHTWLRQMLLFVDEVHRIVPAHYPLDDSDDLKRLREACGGAVQVCEPQHYIQVDENRATLFGRALDAPRFRQIARSKELSIQIGPEGRNRIENWEFLHVDKIGYSVNLELRKRDMIRPSPFPGQEYWPIVPRGVGGLVVGMIADQVADRNGFDAVTDEPLAFALNSLGQCSERTDHMIEGIIASTVASVHVPRDIASLPVKDYAELRKRHGKVRSEFAKMVRDLKDVQRMHRGLTSEVFRDKLDGIVEHIGSEIVRFRASKAATKISDWVPFALTSVVPLSFALAGRKLEAVTTGVISVGVTAISKLTKKSPQFSHPKVLQTLCAANDASAKAAIRQLNTRTRKVISN